MRQTRAKAGRLAAGVAAILLMFSPLANAQRLIVVSIPDRKLALVEDGQVVKTYDVAVGREETPTPAGTYTIVNRISNPTYYHPGTVIPAGKNNPLGPRWIGLSEKHYAIHGTNEPQSIGKAASHGCVRMAAKDVKELFERVRVGDVVEIHGERDEQMAQVFGTVVTAETTGAAAHGGSR